MEIENFLREKDIKVTPQRRAILKALNQADAVLTAQELFQEVLKEFPGINFSTVYRNLSLLASKNILCQISTPNGMLYELRKNDEHHHHIICKGCGESVTIDFCPMEDIEKTLSKAGFEATEHRFEIYGYCKECKGKNQNCPKG